MRYPCDQSFPAFFALVIEQLDTPPLMVHICIRGWDLSQVEGEKSLEWKKSAADDSIFTMEICNDNQKEKVLITEVVCRITQWIQYNEWKWNPVHFIIYFRAGKYFLMPNNETATNSMKTTILRKSKTPLLTLSFPENFHMIGYEGFVREVCLISQVKKHPLYNSVSSECVRKPAKPVFMELPLGSEEVRELF